MSLAIVTGGATGIGKAVCLALGERRFHVVVNARDDAQGGQDTVDLVVGAGGQATFIQADVTREAEVDALYERLPSPPSVLVNNAGRNTVCRLGQWSAEHWDDMFRVNLLSTALMSQRFVETTRSDHASIVNLGTIRALDAAATIETVAYSAAKAGVLNLTSALARALAPKISVNSVTPGYVRTRYLETASMEQVNSWLSRVPIGRFIEPREIAAAVAFLIDNPAITGANLVVDGGWRLETTA